MIDLKAIDFEHEIDQNNEIAVCVPFRRFLARQKKHSGVFVPQEL